MGIYTVAQNASCVAGTPTALVFENDLKLDGVAYPANEAHKGKLLNSTNSFICAEPTGISNGNIMPGTNDACGSEPPPESYTCEDYWPGNGIIFFRDSNCSSSNGNQWRVAATGFYNLTNYGFNDDAFSVHISPDWSARIYEDTNRGGSERCLTGPMWDLTIDDYDDGSPIVQNGVSTISSVEIYMNDSCYEDDITNPSGDVKLYSLVNYEGTLLYSDNTGFSNSTAANSYSLQMPSGWSVKTWKGDDRSGEMRC